jgi:hypothetical protein
VFWAEVQESGPISKSRFNTMITPTLRTIIYRNQQIGKHQTGMNMKIKRTLRTLLAAACVFAGSTSLFATITITPATGGSSISADNTGGTWTTLTGPVLTEGQNKDVNTTGSIVLNAPSGFIFNTASTVTVAVTTNGTVSGGNTVLALASSTATVTTTTITVNVTATGSGSGKSIVTWSGIQVRPSAGTPLASGNITESGTASIPSITQNSSSFGALSETLGALDHFTVNSFTSPQVAGVAFNITMIAKDQFENTMTNFASTVALSTTATSISPTTSGSFSAGVRTESVTVTGSGSGKTITATSSGGKTGVSAGFTVNPAGISAANSVVSVSSSTIGFGQTSTITLQAKDAFGNNRTSGGSVVTFGLGSGTSIGTIGLTTDNGNGTYTATFTATLAGTARTITASILTVGSVSSTLPTITVMDPYVTVPPANVTIAAGAAVDLSVTAVSAGTLSYQWKSNGTDIASATSSVLSLKNLQSTTTYSVVVTRDGGSSTSVSVTVTVTPSAPIILTDVPNQKAGIVYGSYTSEVTKDAGSTFYLSFPTYGSDPRTYFWRKNGQLIETSTNFVHRFVNVQSTDQGNYTMVASNSLGSVTSSVVTLTVTGVAPSPVSISPLSPTRLPGGSVKFVCSGGGGGSLPLTYTWKVNNVTVQSGPANYYTRAALTPADGGTYEVEVSNGTAPNQTASTTLTIDDRFVDLTGTFHGLFCVNGNTNHATSGHMTLTLTNSGKFTGKMVINGATQSFAGTFPATSLTSVTVGNIATSGGLTASLTLDLTGSDQITGTVGNGTWTAQLVANRDTWDATSNPAVVYAGKYTLLVPGNDNVASGPGGDGYALITVGTDGIAKSSGIFGDGTPFTHTAELSKDGALCFYVDPYRGAGSGYGWLNFTLADGVAANVAGSVSTIKTAGANSSIYPIYPSGFSFVSGAIGSRYTVPAGTNNAINGVTLFRFETNGPSSTVTIPVLLGTNKLVAPRPNTYSIKGSINTNNGMFSGSFVLGGQTNYFKGAVLQDQDFATGTFTNAASAVSGLIYLGH